MVTNDTKPIPEEPQTFNKAWDHSNKNSHRKWQEALHKKFTNMNEQQVWCMTCKSLMPPYCRCGKNKWVFKIKRNGVYRACLMACRYSQIPSVDFPENYSEVVNDITSCILLLMVLHFCYSVKIVNIESSFLHRDMEKEIYMKCLWGISNMQKDDCTILNKCIYALFEQQGNTIKRLLRFWRIWDL